ncbi:MAG: hypothetical protein V7K88_28700 [Nostoc sp.]
MILPLAWFLLVLAMYANKSHRELWLLGMAAILMQYCVGFA